MLSFIGTERFFVSQSTNLYHTSFQAIKICHIKYKNPKKQFLTWVFMWAYKITKLILKQKHCSFAIHLKTRTLKNKWTTETRKEIFGNNGKITIINHQDYSHLKFLFGLINTKLSCASKLWHKISDSLHALIQIGTNFALSN